MQKKPSLVFISLIPFASFGSTKQRHGNLARLNFMKFNYMKFVLINKNSKDLMIPAYFIV